MKTEKAESPFVWLLVTVEAALISIQFSFEKYQFDQRQQSKTTTIIYVVQAFTRNLQDVLQGEIYTDFLYSFIQILQRVM